MFKVASSLEQAGREMLAAERGPDYYKKLIYDDGKHVDEMRKLFEIWKEDAAKDEEELKEIGDIERKWEQTRLPQKMDTIVAYAKKVNEPGEDYYGYDYIAQTAPSKELKEFIEADIGEWSDLDEIMDKLEKWANHSLMSLKREAQHKNITL